jgi:hypothetical protein
MGDVANLPELNNRIERLECRVVLPVPHLKQREFIFSAKKRKIFRAGRRSGKTTAAAIMAVCYLLNGKHVLYAAPTAIQVEKFWSECLCALAEVIQRGVYKKAEHKIFPAHEDGTKACISVRTAWNADSLRGEYADLLILDEWQLMDEDTWDLVGQPMLADKDGDAVFIYTPPSLHSRSAQKARDPRHAAKMFKRYQHDPRWQCVSGTTYDNPHISAAGIAEISKDMTQLAMRQEILAEDIEEVEGALLTQALIDETRVA